MTDHSSNNAINNSESNNKIIVDLHIPYCIQPEKYLNRYFAVGTNAEKNSYMEAITREAAAYADDLKNYTVAAVRLSGGAATVMAPDRLGHLLSIVRRSFPMRRGAQISFDAAPMTIGTPALTGIGAGRPNRAELMMRSSDDRELEALNCSFRMAQVNSAILFFNRFRLNNYGITINYGIPGQTPVSWSNTLKAVAIYRPAHVKVQPLDVTDAPDMPDEDVRYAMYETACEYLKGEGYQHYTTDCFCLAHHEDMFEVERLNGCSVAGLGVNGVSMLDGYLTRNTNNLKLYIGNAGDFSRTIVKTYTIDKQFLMKNYAMGRIHTMQGLCEADFEKHFEEPLPESIHRDLELMEDKKWLEEKDGIIVPTLQGAFHEKGFRIS